MYVHVPKQLVVSKNNMLPEFYKVFVFVPRAFCGNPNNEDVDDISNILEYL